MSPFRAYCVQHTRADRSSLLRKVVGDDLQSRFHLISMACHQRAIVRACPFDKSSPRWQVPLGVLFRLHQRVGPLPILSRMDTTCMTTSGLGNHLLCSPIQELQASPDTPFGSYPNP